jgi:ferrous iron transport protein B
MAESTARDGPLDTLPGPGAPASAAPAPNPARVALLGNPNTGKTSLFNRLCGLRAHVANYPGITADARIGMARIGARALRIVDLPGAYSLDLDLPESRLCRKILRAEDGEPPAGAVIVVLDASNLERNLTLFAEAARTGLPLVVAMTMRDIAARRGIEVDPAALRAALGVPVVAVNARRGEGSAELIASLDSAAPAAPADELPPAGAGHAALEAWSRAIARRATHVVPAPPDRTTDRLDRALTHPIVGVLAFLATMGGLFAAIFWLAAYPMGWIESLFGLLGGAVSTALPAGHGRDLLVEGVVGGIAGTVVFLPQICFLFFLLTLLEDTGYLARAAFVANRLLRPFGLPGHAFVPLLSSHACAIPGIICTRLIPDRRDRLATILVAPFLSCSARLPVYALLTGILFAGRPALAGLAFAGCYLLGGAAALLTALLFRSTFLRGRSRPLVLELPPYRLPSVSAALRTAIDRGVLFVTKAGTVILLICIVLWWLSAFPGVEESAAVGELRARAAAAGASDPGAAEALAADADRLAAREALAGSFSGRLGRAIEPVFEPIGADWQISIAILSSFLAREVFVSSLVVTLGAGEVEEGNEVLGIVDAATRDDGSRLLDLPAAAGLLVFYVLAMQCLPTLAVTRREAGGWRWALLQFAYMSTVAWLLAAATRAIVAMTQGGAG